MSKRKKKKEVIKAPVVKKPIETQYYWCVNCGHHGDYGKVKKRGLSCEECDYDEVTPYTKKEIESDYCYRGLDSFKTKKQIEKEEKVPADHVEMRKVAKDAKKLLKNLDEKYSKQSIADKIAAIRGIK